MTKPTNLASSPTMRRSLIETFADLAAIDAAEDLLLGRNPHPDQHAWQRGQDESEEQLWRGFGEGA